MERLHVVFFFLDRGNSDFRKKSRHFILETDGCWCYCKRFDKKIFSLQMCDPAVFYPLFSHQPNINLKPDSGLKISCWKEAVTGGVLWQVQILRCDGVCLRKTTTGVCVCLRERESERKRVSINMVNILPCTQHLTPFFHTSCDKKHEHSSEWLTPHSFITQAMAQSVFICFPSDLTHPVNKDA